MALTRGPGELCLTAGLDDLAVGGQVPEGGLAPLGLHPQLAVVLQDLSCRGLGHFRVQSLQRGRGGGEVLVFIIPDVPGIAGAAGKLVEAGGLLAFHGQPTGLGAVLDEAVSQRNRIRALLLDEFIFFPFSPNPHSNQPIPFSSFPVPPPRPQEYVKSLWAARCQEWLSQAAVTAVSEATVAAHSWRGASLPGWEGQREDR